MKILCLALLLAAGLSAPSSSAQSVYSAGDIIENFSLINRRTGEPMQLSEFSGKILFLDFFAHWCPVCNAAAPQLDTGVYERYREAGNAAGLPVVYVLCNLQGDFTPRDISGTDAFISRFGTDVAVLQDNNRALQHRFTSAAGQPTFAVINGVANSPSHRQWELVFSLHGYTSPGRVQPIEDFQAAIDSVLAPTAVTPVQITSHPQGGQFVPGANVTLTVTASGTGPLTYQWQRNGANLSGDTSPSLTINNLQSSDAGSYVVVVSNAAGSVSSDAAVVTLVGPVTISTHPQGGQFVPGANVTLTVTASGTGPLTYQWQRNGANLSGDTSPSLTINNLQSSDAGSYVVVVSNAAGSVSSDAAVVTLVTPVTISTHPQGGQFVPGANVTLTVTASGTGPLTYQWQRNGANLSGDTSPSLTINNLQSSDAGSYVVVVSNAAGSVSSDAAVVTLVGPVTISTHPQGGQFVPGANVTLTVTASGTGPLTYQWQRNGANLSGDTSPSLTINNLQSSDAGSYVVVVSNAAGSVSSDAAVVTLVTPVTISTHPQGGQFVPGANVTLTVTASGTGPLTYQWQRNGANLSGDTSPSLTINNLQSSDAGSYVVVVSNAAGSVSSDAAVVTLVTPVTISTHPQGGQFVPGANVTLTVTASGTGPLTYQWQRNGANLSGDTSPSLTINNLQSSDAGSYVVVVSNAAGSVSSDAAVVTLVGPVTISTHPQGGQFVPGANVTLTVTASGTGPLTYQWQRNGANLSGDTSPSLTINNLQSSDAGSYVVVVSNAAGSVSSDAAVVTLVTPVTISTHPQGGQFVPGANVTLTVTASGTGPLTYQWQRNGANLSGDTSPSLTINNLQSSDAGSYVVVVSNAAGSVSSDAAVVTLVGPVTISTHPQGGQFVPGANVTLTVTASGTGPLTYQWQRNGANLSGDTSPSLTINNLQSSDAGSYVVVVSNAAGSVSSDAAVVTVEEIIEIPARLSNVRFSSAVGFEFDFIGTPGRIYRVEVSSDLNDWSVLSRIEGSTEVQTVKDSVSAFRPARFYRTVEE